jgi:mannosyl-oligosaccharide alpha-1,2-mannosidase
VLHVDPSLAAVEEDDSARCRLSGICEGRPTPDECKKIATEADKQTCPSYEFAARRDADLSCEFSSSGRAERVRDAARWTWKGYRDCSHGLDELRPLSCQGLEWHNLQLTAVDALDSLALMNLHQEFNEALHLVKEHLKPIEECNVFETTIRILGGLLSTQNLVAAHYDPTTDDTGAHASTALDLLNAAVDVGSRLLQAFNSPSGVPYSDINLSTGSIERSVTHSSMAETTTLSLEFTLLARLTGEDSFEKAALKVHDVLTPSVEKYDGILPQFVSPADGSCSGEYFMLGARSDSYYEYLLKQWILTGQTDELMLTRYIHAIKSVRRKLLRRSTSTTSTTGLLYIAEESGNAISSKMDHLVCFLPGVLALGDFYNISTSSNTTQSTESTSSSNYYYETASDLEIAEELAETCYQLYRRTPTGLAPEIVFFNEADSTDRSTSSTSSTPSTTPVEGSYPGAHASDIGGGDFSIKEDDAHNLLRPETVESLFILWKVTGNSKYQEQAWLIFRAFEKWTRVEGVEQCLGVDAEAAAGTASREVARVAAIEAARALVQKSETSAEQAIKQGIDAGKAALQAMRLPSTENSRKNDNDGLVSQAALVANACLGAAEAAAKATVQMLQISSHANFTLEDIPALFELDASVTTSARVCDFSTLLGGGYSNLESVKSVPPPRRDKMESFWIAETLKYLYLIFTEPPDRCLHPSCRDLQGEDCLLPLTKFVFNTEAHPFPIVGPKDNSLIKSVGEIDSKLLTPFTELSDEPVHLAAAEEESEVEEEENAAEDIDEEDINNECAAPQPEEDSGSSEDEQQHTEL